MKKVILGALALVAGCFPSGPGPTQTCTVSRNAYGAQGYCTTDFPPLHPDAQGAPAYLIDAGADVVNPPVGAYTVTTNGQGDWILGWYGDGLARRYTGDIYTPVGSRISSAVFTNAMFGDSVNTIADNHIGFDAVTDYTVPQTLQIAADRVSNIPEPVTFDLYIDGAPALNLNMFFPSGGQLGHSDVMPVNLVSSTAVFADKVDLAPLAKLPEDRKQTFTLQAPRPRGGGASTESKSQVVEASAKE
jgi:hypothetical protein